jgi:hypothetical protein
VKNLLIENKPKGESPSKSRGFEFEAIDVTGTRSLRVRGIDPATPAGPVARALAARMDLPRDVPWALRNDKNGALLDDDKPLAEQIEPGNVVSVTPKAHLGAF